MQVQRYPMRSWLAAFLLALAAPVCGAADSPMEAKIKAAYIFHLINFVEWPNLPEENFRICVRSAGRVGELLDELSNRTARGRPIQVARDGDPTQCQMIYFGNREQAPAELLARLGKAGVLAVGDGEGFAGRGGIVGFYTDAGKIKLEVNQEASRAAHLRLSSKLLELARSVSGGSP